MDGRNDYSQVLLVPSRTLLVLAGAAWIAAGAGIISASKQASSQPWSWWMGVLALVVFTVFLMMFLRLSQRNAKRILGISARLCFILDFFDANSYVIMVLMIFLGTAVRLSTFVPDTYIASFYLGLGAALILAGLYPLIVYLETWDSPRFH